MAQTTVKDRLLVELGISVDDAERRMLAENALWQAGELIKDKRRTLEVEPRFEYIQFQIAVRLWNVRGMEGETAHSENGINRSYSQDGVIADLMARVPSPVIVG